MANAFLTHHKAAAVAHRAGNHAQAMHHLGHMMRISLSSKRGAAVTPAADDGLSGNNMDADDDAPTAGISTPAPTPASSGRFFGQFGPKATPTAAPHATGTGGTNPALSATNHAPSGGFNRARFAKRS